MPTFFNHRLIRNTFHRLPAKLVLLCYVWMCCGGALPATLIMSSETMKMVLGKDRSVPFPCMHKPCGCRNAEQCFKSCCCMTKAERIAWAKEHSVSEKYIKFASEAEDQPPQKQSSCCVKQATTNCCQAESRPPSCCGKHQAAGDKDECCSKAPGFSTKSVPVRKPVQKSSPGISFLAAMKCQGLGTTWLGVPLAVPPVFGEWCFILSATETVVVLDNFYAAFADAPSTPPPNFILA